MPILRRAPDNTLAETLGGLANLWDPQRAAQAQLLQRQIWLRDLELRKQKAQQEAEDAVIAQYGRIVARENLPYLVQAVRSGMSADKVMELSMRLAPQGIFRDENTPEADAHNRAMWLKLKGTPYEGVGPMPVGDNTSKARAAFDAQAAGTKRGAERGAELTAEDAQRAGLAGQYVPHPQTDDDYRKNLEIWRRINPGKDDPPGSIVVVDEASRQRQQDVAAGQKGREAASTARGTLEGGGTKDRVTIPKPGALPPLPGGGGTGDLTPRAAPAAPAQAPGAPAVVQERIPSAAPGSYATGPVVRTETPSAVTLGEDPSETKLREQGNEATYKRLSDMADQEQNAQRLLTTVTQIRTLVNALNAGGVLDQAWLAANKALVDRFHITAGDTGAMYRALEQLYATELPQVIKDANTIARGPEILAFKVIPGTADMPPAVANDIVARQEALARQAVERARDAGRVLGRDPSSPLLMPDFEANERRRYDEQTATVLDFQKRYGGIGAKAAEPAQTYKPAASVPVRPQVIPQAPPEARPPAAPPPPAVSASPPASAPAVVDQPPPPAPVPQAPAPVPAPQAAPGAFQTPPPGTVLEFGKRPDGSFFYIPPGATPPPPGDGGPLR